MERNWLAGLLGGAVVGILSGIEWIVLTFLLLAVGLVLSERFASRGPSILDAGDGKAVIDLAPQQPVVIQTSTHSPAHNFYTHLVNSMVEQSMLSSDYSNVGIHKKINPKFDSLQSHLDKKFSKIERELDHIKKHARHNHH
ncbi:hypothetical protein HY572_04845 [Candidatus Micrarchaeota archaeon]|nr:hypothetical protein [Candidatus Micrarchaeota archaeon]